MNKKEKLDMNEKEYTPHCLRAGGCTDKARSGVPGYCIERAGRWASKVWKLTYIHTDWSDISKLSTIPIYKLSHQAPNPFTES